MIYFLQNGDPNLVKIGYSNKPSRRRGDLDTGSPTELHDLIPPIPGTKKREHWIHLKFAHLRIDPRKEWFRLDGDLRKFIFRFLGENKYDVNESLPLLEEIDKRTKQENNHFNLFLRICSYQLDHVNKTGKISKGIFWQLFHTMQASDEFNVSKCFNFGAYKCPE